MISSVLALSKITWVEGSDLPGYIRIPTKKAGDSFNGDAMRTRRIGLTTGSPAGVTSGSRFNSGHLLLILLPLFLSSCMTNKIYLGHPVFNKDGKQVTYYCLDMFAKRNGHVFIAPNEKYKGTCTIDTEQLLVEVIK